MKPLMFATLWGALLALSSASRAEEPWPSGHDAAAPSTPFSAVALADSSYVRLRPDVSSPSVGVLHRGATVMVSACRPDCVTDGAWALLGADGAIRLSLLRIGSNPDAADVIPPAEDLDYGRVGRGGVRIYKEASLGRGILTQRRIPREMAFRRNPALRADGWLQRIEGGYVRARLVDALAPSPFKGEAEPRLPLAFVVRELGVVGSERTVTDRLHRYDRRPLLGVNGARVETDRGSLPRSAVRIASLRARPAGVPAGARWVHIDLAQQTLVAYEDERPVLATLISAGKVGRETMTHPGLYQVEHKMIYSNMHGEPGDPYDVDRVPYVLYFHKDEALHGAYWHDGFGTRASHGCVNLSLADARWLFAWAPPRLPAGWSVVEAKEVGAEALWVLIETRAPLAAMWTPRKAVTRDRAPPSDTHR